MKALRIEQPSTAAGASVRREPALALVPQTSPSERARQLMREARAAALDHLALLVRALETAQETAAAVADGGDLYGVGVRELAARLNEDLLWKGRTLQALAERERQGLLAH